MLIVVISHKFVKQEPFHSQLVLVASNKPFNLIHDDIWGPISHISLHGHKYFLTIVDDYYRHTWIFIMKLKAETSKLV